MPISRAYVTVFVHAMFGSEIGLRFRPSFFPFTEPAAEVDIDVCYLQGNRIAGSVHRPDGSEILGSGWSHPAVFSMAVNYDPEEYTGFAFGMGVERVAMLKYGIDDIRLFFENDLRFLRQF